MGTNAFAWGENGNIEQRRIISAALGASDAAPFNRNDVGKAVKMGTAQNYVPVANGDEIEGFVSSVEVVTVNGGFSFGGVQRGGYVVAEVGANQGATPMAIRDYVLADVPVALGTAGLPKVKTGAAAKFLWRVCRIITGTGVAGDQVLLVREN